MKKVAYYVLDENQTRDYDKEPIVIKDYNYMFRMLVNLPFALCFILAYIYNPFVLEDTSSLRNGVFIVMPLMFTPYVIAFLKARNRRKIVLSSQYITYYHEDKILEKIDINEIDSVKRTFVDFYHKSQRDNSWGYILSIITFPITILMHASLIICKIFFHAFKSNFNFYKFYDSIIIFDKNGKFINILFVSNHDYEDVKNYFLNKKEVNIDYCNKFLKLSYLYEKIDYEEL